MMSTLIAVMAIAPLLGPIIGGQIATYRGSKGIGRAVVEVLDRLRRLPDNPAGWKTRAVLVSSEE